MNFNILHWQGRKFINIKIQTTMKLDDNDIIKRLKENDNKVISDIYLRYHEEFVGYIKKQFSGYGRTIAEDVYSECFHALYRNIKSGRLVSFGNGSLKTYLFAIGKYKMIDEINRQRKLKGESIIKYLPSDEIQDLDYYEMEDIQVKKNLLVNQVVKKLTEPCKTIITLFWYERKKDKEIVLQTRYHSTATIKNQRSRCMRTLKKEIISELEKEKMITADLRNKLLAK
jgi:RNA polymerase sigma factor (sigma-70 family)